MRRNTTRKFSILALLFILLSLPLAIYSIINLPSFDTREKAADLTLDTQTCLIRFPYVNPSSIEINKTVQAIVSANTPNEAIVSVSIMDRTGTAVLSKEYTDGRDTISEKFTISPKTEGDFGILGTLTTDKGTRPCVVESKKTVMVVSANNAPEFKTQPTSAKPSNAIKVNDNYQYQLEATDTEKDNINFAFSFTPNANWLKSTVIENGTNGRLTIKFTGIPDKPASYLANIFIHDGYNAHLRAQTWVISVDQDKNDVPKVSIIQPSTDIKIQKGEKITVSWEGTDLNQITKYELYIATNPGNENTWMPINKDISHKVGNYIVDTKDIKDGTYQFIVRAIDNYQPPATGMGVSAKVTIGQEKQEGPDDGVVVQEATIINLSPSNESQIKNKNAVISATLVPGKEAEVKKESIKVVFDDNDITEKTRVTENGEDKSYSVIYSPEKPHTEGIHKVKISFEDTKGNKAEKEWTFTVIPDTDENSDVFKIFGFEIPKRIATIVAAGLAILLLALIVPWLLYLAWRGTRDNDEDDYEEMYKNTTSPTPPNTTFTVDTDEKPLEEVKEEIKEEKPKFTFAKFDLGKRKKEKENLEKELTENIEVKEEKVIEQPVEQITTEIPVQMEENSAEPIQSTQQPTTNIEEIQEEIEEDTNRELEELAVKLQAKEEMIDQFIQPDQSSAPSSLTDNSQTAVTENTQNPADVSVPQEIPSENIPLVVEDSQNTPTTSVNVQENQAPNMPENQPIPEVVNNDLTDNNTSQNQNNQNNSDNTQPKI